MSDNRKHALRSNPSWPDVAEGERAPMTQQAREMASSAADTARGYAESAREAVMGKPTEETSRGAPMTQQAREMASSAVDTARGHGESAKEAVMGKPEEGRGILTSVHISYV